MRQVSDRFFQLKSAKRGCLAVVLFGITAMTLAAQRFTTLLDFNGADGANPSVALIQGTDGNFYGTAATGGISNNICVLESCGTVFRIDRAGTLTTLYRFCPQPQCADGSYPNGNLIQGADGDFYGTTAFGGTNNGGTIFKLTPQGELTTLYRFCASTGCPDGQAPVGLTQSSNGDLYGVTENGGNACYYPTGCGTLFRLSPSGLFTQLYSFCPQAGCADGAIPVAGLVEAFDGNFYGTTGGGGLTNCSGYGCGTVFRMTPHGSVTTIYEFCSLPGCLDGAGPGAALISAPGGNFYGTTQIGGSSANQYASGTVFRITPRGSLTTLYNFCVDAPPNTCPDGEQPLGLLRANDGNLYGPTDFGGEYNEATLFRVTPTGTLTTLHQFCPDNLPCPDGARSVTPLLQATNGNLYGTTYYGGDTNQDGTVFKLALGLPPFVKVEPASGTVGAQVRILGYGLTGSVQVTFDVVDAGFKVVSDTLIIATVPVGALDGIVRVVTPSGTLSSNAPFNVRP